MRELVAEASIVVDGTDVERLLEGHATDIDEAAEHVRGEARALLVGEEADGDRVHRVDAALLECLDDLEPGEHAEVAVEAPAGRHRVDVRAGHHRGRRRVGARPGGHDVADGVDADVEPEVVHPPDDEVASRAISVGQRQPGTALLAVRPLDRPDLPELDDSRPQPIPVNPEIVHLHSSKAAISAKASQKAVTAAANSSAPRSAVAGTGSPMTPSAPKSSDSQPNETGPPKRT